MAIKRTPGWAIVARLVVAMFVFIGGPMAESRAAGNLECPDIGAGHVQWSIVVSLLIGSILLAGHFHLRDRDEALHGRKHVLLEVRRGKVVQELLGARGGLALRVHVLVRPDRVHAGRDAVGAGNDRAPGMRATQVMGDF